SQEAPVILLRAEKKEERLGGAASVANMLRTLGARVRVAGVAGSDADGARLRGMLVDQGIDAEAVLVDAGRPTTVKERYIGKAAHRHPQQMMRVDYETREELPAAMENRLGEFLLKQARDYDLVLVSDYDKGVCTPKLLGRVIAACQSAGVRIIADPIRGGDYRKYHGVSAMTPNRLEAGLATGRELNSAAEALAAAAVLRERLDMEASIITLDREGMALCHRDGRLRIHPTRPRQVYDITGAGDMVMAVLGLALASGADYSDAIRLANIAGGLEVEKIGVAPLSREEILADIPKSYPGRQVQETAGKLLPLDRLKQAVAESRAQGKRIVFTNGCFDLLHAGHVQYLQEARTQGDLLIVGLNSDESVKRLKGPTRPVNKAEARSLVLSALQCVDYLTVFDELTPLELIRAVRPEVLVKGADYQKDEVVGREFVESYGGRVHLALVRPGVSTTGILQRLEAA
ncbi:MAG: D-glycero-beta-D-manno-heptose 1-phosphate adenylyltransferase, partial [Gemmataceae bacterium]|nr:D-glycero-beta-D-manno-heptose 1-phosphate adenylyltransferase [Gemmataceae bacterium]